MGTHRTADVGSRCGVSASWGGDPTSCASPATRVRADRVPQRVFRHHPTSSSCRARRHHSDGNHRRSWNRPPRCDSRKGRQSADRPVLRRRRGTRRDRRGSRYSTAAEQRLGDQHRYSLESGDDAGPCCTDDGPRTARALALGSVTWSGDARERARCALSEYSVPLKPMLGCIALLRVLPNRPLTPEPSARGEVTWTSTRSPRARPSSCPSMSLAVSCISVTPIRPKGMVS